MLKKHGLLEASKKGKGGKKGSGTARAARRDHESDAPAGIGGRVPEPDPPGILQNLQAIQSAFGGWLGGREVKLSKERDLSFPHDAEKTVNCYLLSHDTNSIPDRFLYPVFLCNSCILCS